MPSRWSQRRERFREILSGSACIHPASVFDPISARIAESLGFEACMFAGSVASLTILGAPDSILITLTEFAGQGHRICRATSLPLMVDADHGYGNALNVMRTVEELETAGISGMSIEDTLLPEPYGGGDTRLLSLEEGIGKMKAAVAARCDKSLVIAARTSATSVTGLEDAVKRVKAYSGTGVDAIFCATVKTREEVAALKAATHLPLILGSIPKALADRDYLGKAGVRIALQGHQSFQAAVQGVYATLRALREGTEPAKLGGLAAPELMATVTRADDYERWMKDFLGT